MEEDERPPVLLAVEFVGPVEFDLWCPGCELPTGFSVWAWVEGEGVTPGLVLYRRCLECRGSLGG